MQKKKYAKPFLYEQKQMLAAGMTEEQIEGFYPTWNRAYRSDITFLERAWYFSFDEDNQPIMDSVSIPLQYDGTQKDHRARQKAFDEDKGVKGDFPWSGIRRTEYHLYGDVSAEDRVFQTNDDSSSFVNQIIDYGEPELARILENLPEEDLEVAEMLIRDVLQKDIAVQMKVTSAAICKRVKRLQAKLETYARKNHLLCG